MFQSRLLKIIANSVLFVIHCELQTIKQMLKQYFNSKLDAHMW